MTCPHNVTAGPLTVVREIEPGVLLFRARCVACGEQAEWEGLDMEDDE